MRAIVERRRSAKPRQRGLTLLELVVAVGVLVLLAGVAVEMVVRGTDETANRVTLKRLERIKEAILDFTRDMVQCRVGDGSSLTNDGIPTAMSIYKLSGKLANESGSCWKGPYGPDVDVDLDWYRDGWGNPLFYYGNGEAAGTEQAVFYLGSSGPDGIRQFVPPNGEPGDDTVVIGHAEDIYHEEADRRAWEINMAIQRYVNILEKAKLLNVPYEVAFNPAGSADALEGYLPNDPRYLWSPWKIDGVFLTTFQPTSNAMPYAQVKAMKP